MMNIAGPFDRCFALPVLTCFEHQLEFFISEGNAFFLVNNSFVPYSLDVFARAFRHPLICNNKAEEGLHDLHVFRGRIWSDAP